MTRLTASGIDRAERCAWGFRPDAGQTNDTNSDAATAGVEDHGHIEASIDEDAAEHEFNDETERGFIGANFGAEVEPKSPTHARWLAEWWPKNRHLAWKTEVAVAIDPLTGETRLGPEGWQHRDYGWAPPRMIPGTIDAYAFDGGTLRINDWKCGQASHIGDPRTSGQLRTLGLALARHLGHRGPVSLEYTKINEHRCWVEAAPLGRADLLAFQGDLLALTRKIDGNPQPVEGHWCSSMWCPYLGRCPATLGALTQLRAGLPEDPFRVVSSAREIRNDAHAQWQYRVLRAADKMLAEAWKALKEHARSRPIPLGDGVEYAEVDKVRETVRIEVPGAEAVLARVLGEHAAGVVEVKRKATKSRIEAAAKPVAAARSLAAGKRVPVTAVAAEVFLGLRSIGAMKVSEYRELGEVRRAVPLAETMGEIGEALRVEREGNAA